MTHDLSRGNTTQDNTAQRLEIGLNHTHAHTNCECALFLKASVNVTFCALTCSYGLLSESRELIFFRAYKADYTVQHLMERSQAV